MINDKATLLVLLQRKKATKKQISSVVNNLPWSPSLSLSIDDVNNIFYSLGVSSPVVSDDDVKYVLELTENNTRSNIHMYSIDDPDYPECLRLIHDAPPVIHIKGDKSVFKKVPGVAIVGARKATINGKKITSRIASYLAERNWVIVSGLALGVDTAAHEGALQAGGATIAVLAGGLDKATPKSNEKLADMILEYSGAWVSEHPYGTPPKKTHFVPRNRIQIGLSAGSIITEAELKSWSMAQANFCIKNNRPLFVVLAESKSNKLGLLCEGTLMLNGKGAVAIRNKNDYPNLERLLFEKFISIK